MTNIITLHHSTNYTLRCLKGRYEVTAEAFRAIDESLRHAIDYLTLDGHLFVTVIPGDTIATGPDELGFGVYHAGIQHVAIAGIQPDNWDEAKDGPWLKELQVTVIHEVVHYHQELMGTLESSEENEAATELLTAEIAKALHEGAKKESK